MSKYVVVASWEHAPHLTQASIDEMLSSIPIHQRKARSEGIPLMGSGLIYPIEEKYVKIANFPIPPHFKRAYAFDTGWNWNAAVWGAYNSEEDILYIYDCYKRGAAEPPINAAAIQMRGAWIPGVADAADINRLDGKQYIEIYRGLGLDIELPNKAFETGVQQVWTRLSTAKLRIFESCVEVFEELRVYSRNEKGMILDNPRHDLCDCYDDQTEVLTYTGWKLFKDLGHGDRIASVNLKTDQIQYQKPTDYIEQDYVGEMIHFGGHKLDAMVTPNHRMVVHPSSRLASKLNPVTFKPASEVSKWDRIKLNAKWRGKKRGNFETETYYGRKAYMKPEVWAELLGWYVAEGSFDKKIQMPGRGYAVYISQTTPAKVEYLKKLLSRTPWRWTYNSSDNFAASSKWLWKQVQPMGNKYEKFVPQWVKDSEPRIIEAFLRGAIAGDGWINGRSHLYCSVSKQLSDDIQELYLKVGRSASVKIGRRGQIGAVVCGRIHNTVDQHWVTEWNHPIGLLHDHNNTPNFKRVFYSGKIYCVTVPNGAMIVRRNGKPMVSGNSMRYLVMSGIQRAKYPPTKKELVFSDYGGALSWMG